jgi:metallo-beta-lactamase class B
MRRRRLAVALLALNLGACVAGSPSATPAATPAAPAAAPSGFPADWYERVPPLRIVGPIHYVGTRELAVYLVTTPEGHILLSGAMPGSEADIVAAIRELGFDPADVRLLLSTHAHMDHVGTLAALKRLTGASLAVAEGDVPLLASGGRSDYLFADEPSFHFEPVAVDRVLHDGDVVQLGGVTLTARLTPGHTPGNTTWITDVEDGGRNWHVVLAGSLTVNPGTRFVHEPSYPGILDDYRRSIALLESLEPDVFLAAHASQFDFAARRARVATEGPRAFADPEA